MKRYLAAATLALSCATAQAGYTDWTDEQRAWYWASNTAIVADWATTRNMSRRWSEGYHEVNPFLGRQPTTQRVDLHFVTCLVAHYFVTDWFKGDNRTLYLQIMTAGESALVANNVSIGLKIKF